MATTQDDVLFEKAMHSIVPQPKKVLQRELLYVIDNNGGSDYSRNQVEFETVSMSNNGKIADYENGFITMPWICTYARSGTHLDINTADGAIALKSPLAMINTATWSYNNDPVIPERDGLAALAHFKILSEWSQDDVQLHGSVVNFHKSNDDWSYTTEYGLRSELTELNASKSGFYDETMGRGSVLPTAVAQQGGYDTFEMAGTTAVFRKDLHIRLKDIPGFKDLPMIRGATIRLTLRLNQGSCVREFVAAIAGVGAALAVHTQVNTLKGSCVPILVTTPPAPSTAAYIETIHWGIGAVNGHSSQKTSCRLYVPSVTMDPLAEKRYLDQGEKQHFYEDYQYVLIKNIGGTAAGATFNENLSNGIKRAKSLLVIPQLSAGANGARGIGSINSLSFDGPVVPYSISDYNVDISGSALYIKPLQYRYEHFQQELAGGRLGVDSGMSAGMSSGLLTKSAHDACHGYLYSDLSRRRQLDDNVSTSISIRGQLRSPKMLDLHCYIMFEKDMTVDLTTGARVA